MKYLVILGDGMADYPCPQLDGKTPLEVANKPNMDALCAKGVIGLVKTVPDGMKPGSDVANLAMMGYAPDKYYTGRSPLEALSIGIDMSSSDIATRCNLVTLSGDEPFENKVMVDYSAGEITTQEAEELIKAVQEALGNDKYSFYSGVSYRHCMITKGGKLGAQYTPPHDISDKVIGEYLPKGEDADEHLAMLQASYQLLKDHPINIERIKQGKNPANCIWLWGEGSKPALDDFGQKYGLKAGVISAVDLVKGIGIGAGMTSWDVEGATGTYHTNFEGKAKRAIDAFREGYDYVYIHMEAPDECGHQGDLDNKIKSIELIDEKVVGYCKRELDEMGEPYRILIAPDHPTPISIKTHVGDPVPFILYDSSSDIDSGFSTYNEKTAKESGIYYEPCQDLIEDFLSKPEETQESSQLADTGESDNEDKAVAPVQPIGDNQAPKTKKPLTAKQKKNIIIAVLCIVAIIGVGLGIGLPVYFHFKDKIMVASAEDFNKDITKGTYFVLSKDVVIDGDLDMSARGNYSIDLQGHTLTVNGTLTYSTDDAKDIKIGNTKKKAYVEGGVVDADKIVINALNANVEILSNTQTSRAEILAKQVTLTSMTSADGIYVGAQNVALKGAISTANASQIELSSTAVDANAQVSATGKINGKLVAQKVDLTATASSGITSIVLDADSTAQISGKVEAGIEGGKKVAMLSGHSCSEYRDIATLAIYRESAGDYTIKGCDKVVYIDKLATPVDLIVEERAGGKIFAVSAKVVGATKYVFNVDGTEHVVESNQLDVSSLMSNGGAGKHIITVFVKGDYDFGALETASGTVYVDSDQAKIEYAYKITLSTPENVQVAEDSNGIYLAFNKVDFADYYTVDVAGQQLRFDADKNATTQKFYLTEVLKAVGNYSVRVTAHSNVAEILSSKQAMASYTKTQQLGTVTELTARENGAQINVSWVAIDGADSYIVYANNAGTLVELGRTSMTSFSFDKTLLGGATEIAVVAQGNGYYTTGGFANATVER